jgi:hypothetical protein
MSDDFTYLDGQDAGRAALPAADPIARGLGHESAAERARGLRARKAFPRPTGTDEDRPWLTRDAT